MARSHAATRATGTSRSSTNGGFIKYDGLLARAEFRASATARAGLSYTLSKTTSNMSTGLSTGGVTNPFDLDEDLRPR